ncbi:acyl-[ACP]--phospholipid O-acyltransferase [Fulvimarina sp. MAC8]|uniref:acyl-[ACP]--phospholipid O-acyltransferase n=1 Tax=Fulvimarina sp. MAC8 TaxID=3162874 RepID=UPI0032EEC0D9
MSRHLLTSRRFLPLFVTQFLSAFNDNLLKNALVFLILFTLASEEAAPLVTLAGAVFMAPFLLFSALGGELADRYDKALVARRLKLAEIGGACLAVAGIALGSVPVLMAALFVFGLVSALFGPIKYGILPDHLETSELPAANAYVEGATFAAILAGTIAGGLLSLGDTTVVVFGPVMIGLSILCYAASRFIPKTGAAAPTLTIDRNILRSTVRLTRELARDGRILKASLMVSWFWVVGAIVLSLMPTLVKDVLGGSEIAVTTYLALFAVAIGIGSALAALVSKGRIVLLPAVVGTVLVAGFSLDLGLMLLGQARNAPTDTLAAFFAGDGTVRAAIDLAGMAIAGSLLVVPAFAALQAWAPKARRARLVAGNNIVNAGFMTLAGGLVAAVQAAGVGLGPILTVLAALNLGAAIVMLKVLPTNPLRDLISVVMRLFHRMEVEGLEHLDAAGPAPILALNHVSFLDGPLALTLTEADPVFAIDRTIAQRWWVKPFVKRTNALPLDPTKPIATRSLIKAVQAGNPLVIFPEGRITVTGSLMKVYDGAGMVADKTGSKIVPIRIDGLERSPFSRLTHALVKKQLFPKVKVTILPPRDLTIDPEFKGRRRRKAAGAALHAIMTESVFEARPTDRTVLEAVIEQARSGGMGALATEDPVTGPLTRGALLTRTRILAERFAAHFEKAETIGLMLPTSNAGAVSFLAMTSAGKVPAMINFTAGAANILSSCRAAQVDTIVTARAFVKQARLEPLVAALSQKLHISYLEDIALGIGMKQKIAGLLGRTKPLVARKASDRAAILFTSGSEGAPKGVVLSHDNILANTAQAAARIDFSGADKVFNVLPIFHSFGLTAGTLLPLTAGVPAYLYPSPLHYRIVPELIYGSNATIIFGTDTFLAGYARTAHPYDFRSVRYCFAGAEPVRASTRATFMESFGLRILEGYGVTEAAPVIAINAPMETRTGSVGRLLPGIEARLEPVPGVEEGGRLFIRGANVMQGYLKAEKPGVLETLEGGWHDTGDIVEIDIDGFVSIKGRAKRFAKIGGEMVSLSAVETLAAELWPGEPVIVSAIPDAKKGERLILLTSAAGADRQAFAAFARSKGAMDLMIPAEIHVVEKMPLLGSGKADFTAAKTLSLELSPTDAGSRKMEAAPVAA